MNTDPEIIQFSCGDGSVIFDKNGTYLNIKVKGEISQDFLLVDIRKEHWNCVLNEYDEYGMELRTKIYKNDGTKFLDVYKDFKRKCLMSWEL